MYEHRLLGRLALRAYEPRHSPPFVEAVHGNEAALALERRLERGLRRQTLGAGVDHLRRDLHGFRPHWHEAPMEDLQTADTIGTFDDAVDVVRRGGVVVR